MTIDALRNVEQVLVVYPRGLQTGGPEALHQLVDSLRRQGRDAYLWPVPETRHLARVADYERYDAPESLSDLDSSTTAVVLHEGAWKHAPRWRRANMCCWWLSIDNSTFFGPRREWARRASTSNGQQCFRLFARAAGAQGRLLRHRSRMRRTAHFTQSWYAAKYLGTRGLAVSATLGDYIPDPPSDYSNGDREDALVVYNPKKGMDITIEAQQRIGSDVRWKAIEGLDRRGVRSLLSSATVYLETGHQPGKDRLPREAGLHGCIVLMLRRGAGANDWDCPLPPVHKVDDSQYAGEDLANLLTTVLRDPGKHQREQIAYVHGIRAERAQFDHDVIAIFGGEQR